MKGKGLAKLLVFIAIVCSLNSCGETSLYQRDETLYVGGAQWGSPCTFNPLAWWSAFPILSGGNNNIMYEHLLKYNILTGELEPLLATLHERTNEHISVIMNPAARWSDGEPLTAEDVVFTFGLSQENAGLPTSYVWDYISDIKVETIEEEGDSFELVKFVMTDAKRLSPLAVLSMMQSVWIVPKHVIQARLEELDGDISALQGERMSDDPVVSGPYTLDNFTNERIVLRRRDDYWGIDALYDGRKPNPKYIIHPILKGNSHFALALQQGTMDVTSTYIPRIWIRERHGVRTWYPEEPYYVAGSIPTIVLNVTKEPLSDVNIRRAMAHAINYADIAELAVSGYSEDLQPGLILPFGNEGRYYCAEDAQKYGRLFDPDKARQILKDAGYSSVIDSRGRLSYMLNADGERVPTVEIMSPAGWSDWEAIVRLVVRDMRAVGIDVRERFIDASTYWTSQPNGDFDMVMHTPAADLTPAHPLARFEAVMSSRDWAPIGTRMNENYGRYNNPNSEDYNSAVDSLIQLIPILTDEEEVKEAYRALNRHYMNDLPALTLVYRPEQYYQFSISNWENFPSNENPYAPPQTPTVGAARDMLWELQSIN
ncbi:Oligopeptide ABC transporter, periplasmic oligopeptide-binding protein OppA [Chitinispirillum alkaliphilum]|nr:Oligopeptide ABC transporter, periplasmic oligopeptide-binding protein OppA [Chitinispirillum alkaliphilum]